MPVSRIPRPGAAGLLLVVVCLSLAACGPSASSAATVAPVSSGATSASASMAAVSVAPTVAPTDHPSPTEAPSATASHVTPAPSPTAFSATSSPTATPAPTRRPTPAPTVKPTAKPTDKPTAGPTAKPTPRPTVAPVVLGIEARDFLFSPSSVTGRAGVPFGIRFTNSDAAIPHNVTVATDAGALRFNGTIINGVASTTYQVPALAAGAYRLGCIVHPAMTGTLTIH